jgi:hypothetical protein
MAPRLRLLLLLLLPAGCAAAGDREAVAMRAALENGQASLTAMAPSTLPAAVVLVGTTARPVLHTPGLHPTGLHPTGPHPIVARHAFRHAAAGDPAGTRPSSAADLLGAGPATLRRWLGEPALRRPEGGAEVWLYAGPGCALDLILYPAGHGLSVAHAAARAQGAEQRTEAACLAEIAGAQEVRPIPAARGTAVLPADPGV